MKSLRCCQFYFDLWRFTERVNDLSAKSKESLLCTQDSPGSAGRFVIVVTKWHIEACFFFTSIFNVGNKKHLFS